jgi:hypothetical protein
MCVKENEMKFAEYIANCDGKTIRAVYDSVSIGSMLVSYTDGCFSIIRAESDDDTASLDEGSTVRRGEFSDNALLESGAYTQEELDRMNQEKASEKEKNEPALNDALRKKFEPTA